MLYIAKQNCRIKSTVVEQDPHEKGMRRIMNYGHTIGHAVEQLSNYEISHGGCVSIGMMVAARIAVHFDYMSDDDLKKQQSLLERAGLPITIPNNIANDDIIAKTALDKKAVEGVARYCLPDGIGAMQVFDGEFARPVDPEVVVKALQATR